MADRGRVGFDRVCNRVLHKRLVNREQHHHRIKLEKIQMRKKGGKLDTLDNSLPDTLNLKHIQTNWKKNAQLKTQEFQIDSENHFLLEGVDRNKVDLQSKPLHAAPKAMAARRRYLELSEITKSNSFLAGRLEHTKGALEPELRYHEKLTASQRHVITQGSRFYDPRAASARKGRPVTTTPERTPLDKFVSAGYKVVMNNMIQDSPESGAPSVGSASGCLGDEGTSNRTLVPVSA